MKNYAKDLSDVHCKCTSHNPPVTNWGKRSKICKAYGGFSVGIKTLEDYLTDVNTFCDIYHNTTGATGVVTAMKNPNGNVQYGLQHMLRVINTYSAAKASTMEFEGNIAEGLSDADNLNNICTGCLYDVKLGTSGFEEFKSYQQTTVDGIAGSTKFYNQFKAYFSQISSMADLSYIFNMGKINQTGTIKLAFKKMLYDGTANNLSSKGSELFEVIWANNLGLRESLFPEITDFDADDAEETAKGLFSNKVSVGSSSFYDFIKVK